jgi:SH3-like domain-containing protein
VKISIHRTIIALLLLLAVCGCGKDSAGTGAEEAYISAPQVVLRDRVAAVYNKVGLVSNGDRVRVLERSSNKRFVRIRTADAKEGWIEQRYLVGPDVFNGFEKLAQENSKAVSQASAVTRRIVNLHVQPARNSDSLYQLKDATKVELLKRASTPKAGLKAVAKVEKPSDSDEDKDKKNSGEDDPAPAPELTSKSKKLTAQPANVPTNMEDWWLVRDQQKRVGWLLGRMLDVDIPLEIAQYAEGQRIVASFVVSEVSVPDESTAGATKKVPQYAVLMSEPRDGMSYDFNQLRVFTWNTKRSRYETAYRERFSGELPFLVTQENYGKEGTLPTFTIRVRDSDGKLLERKYKMNGVMVRRVLAPGETPAPRHRR